MGRERGNGGRGWVGRFVVDMVVVLVAVASSYVGGSGGTLPGRGPFSDMLIFEILEIAGCCVVAGDGGGARRLSDEIRSECKVCTSWGCIQEE